jgi:hypothetical protein
MAVEGSLTDKRPSIWCLAVAIMIATATSVGSQPSSSSELTAVSRAERVFVSFELHAELHAKDYDDVDLRLSHQSVTVVSWAVELRLLAHWLPDRSWTSAMIRAFAQPLGNDRFAVSRSVNGQLTESGVLVDRRGAHRWLTSFSDVPLFERIQLAHHADHVLTIRATVEGGGETTVVTSSLARAPLLR